MGVLCPSCAAGPRRRPPSRRYPPFLLQIHPLDLSWTVLSACLYLQIARPVSSRFLQSPTGTFSFGSRSPSRLRPSCTSPSTRTTPRLPQPHQTARERARWSRAPRKRSRVSRREASCGRGGVSTTDQLARSLACPGRSPATSPGWPRTTRSGCESRCCHDNKSRADHFLFFSRAEIQTSSVRGTGPATPSSCPASRPESRADVCPPSHPGFSCVVMES